jgi:hypothetical protein
VADAEAPHFIEQFCIDGGASFNTFKIVPLITFTEGLLRRSKEAHVQ